MAQRPTRVAKPATVYFSLIGMLLTSSGAFASVEGASERNALEYAFEFASAIQADPKDMAKAQESVIRAYAEAGELEEAIVHADLIEGWRRGVAYADLATALAREGRTEDAAALVAKAESVQRSTEGWQGPRINAHIASALAALGDAERTTEIARDLAVNDGQQYAGRAVATRAGALAAAGQFDDAMKQLATLDGEVDFQMSWWRTRGYLDLARGREVSEQDSERALAAARKSADGIAGWKRIEMLDEIADEQRTSGDTEAARGTLAEGERLVATLADTTPMKAPLQARLARSWNRMGERKHARELLSGAETVAGRAINIDRPIIYAELAASYAVLGDTAEATRLYDDAFTSAEALVNARPRALAVVGICRSMGRYEFSLTDGARARLDALYAGLGDPW